MKSKLVRRIAALAVMIVLALVAYYQYSDKMFYYRFLEGQYQRSFYELVDHVQNVQTNLAKLMVADSTTQDINLLSDTWRQAYAAQANLSQLPVSAISVTKTSKFLTQVGDFANSLVRKRATGNKIDSTDMRKLEELHKTAATLTVDMQNMRNDIATKGVTIFNPGTKRALLSQGGTGTKDVLGVGLSNVERQMSNYPKLIYDGPFSSHLENVPPKGLTGSDVSENVAKNNAISFIGKKNVKSIKTMTINYPKRNTTKTFSPSKPDFPTYSFAINTTSSYNSGILINVSKKGGHIVWMINQRPVSNVNISIKQAQVKADDFLKNKGFGNMVITHSEKYDGAAVFNYAYSQNGVVIYPDLVKVKVGLDNGEVIGFDAKGYYTNHVKRDIKKPKLTQAQAKAKVSKNLKIESQKLALIPLENKVEVLTYEFKGMHNGDTFYIYIDANTGKEVKVLQQIKTYKGNLTM